MSTEGGYDMTALERRLWNKALEAAAQIAESAIPEMEAMQAGWRVSLGPLCDQPYDEEIRTRRNIAEAIRALRSIGNQSSAKTAEG